ncbi:MULTISPECIES: DUF2517 family protein [unclassified Agarivorans]|uniref:DUF2517 family protein n=1 Tax=unclassified Agarivorans TaxID=2636026 RepID=UPI003D7D41BD
MSKQYSLPLIWLRRSVLLLVGTLLFPWIALLGLRAPFYSALHRQWVKRNNLPAWMQQAERINQFVLY